MDGLAARLEEAFWAAADATQEDETVHGLGQPYFDQSMETVDGHIPPQFWVHMAAWWDKNGKF